MRALSPEFVATAAAGTSAGGLAALLAHPVFAPFWGLVASMIVAYGFRLLNRLNRNASPAELRAQEIARELVAQALVDVVRNRQASAVPVARSSPGQLTLPTVAGVTALVFALMSAGCAGWTPRDYVRAGLETTARFSVSAASTVLESYCTAQLRVLHRAGRYDGVSCVSQSIPRPATPDETAELATVRTRWAPVIAAYDTFVSIHALGVDAVEAGDAITARQWPVLLQRLTDAYTELVRVAGQCGLRLPDLFGAGVQ